MKILYILMPVALVLSLVSTGLFLTGMVTPHWFHVHPPGVNETVYYGLFVICHENPQDCHSWISHENGYSDDLMDKISVGTGASEVILSMNALALVESVVILLWCVCKSCTRYWAKSAYTCTLSGLLYGVLGTASFLGVRIKIENATSEKFRDPHRLVSLEWSAILVVTGVVMEMLTALCLKLALLCSMTKEAEPNSSSLLLSLQSPFAQCNKGLVPRVSGMTCDKRMRTSITASMESAGSDLLHLVQMKRQTDKNKSTLTATRTVSTYQGRPPKRSPRNSSCLGLRLSMLKEMTSTVCPASHSLMDNGTDVNLEKRESVQFNELMELFSHPEAELRKENFPQTDLGSTEVDADAKLNAQPNQKGGD